MFARFNLKNPAHRRKLVLAFAAVTMAGIAVEASSQALPNPYRAVDGWAQLPDGRQMGAVGGVTIDSDGKHVWAVVRCDATDPERFGNECLDSDLDPILKFDLDGKVVQSFGSGLFIWPHGIDVDPDGNVWVTDAAVVPRVVIQYRVPGSALQGIQITGPIANKTLDTGNVRFRFSTGEYRYFMSALNCVTHHWGTNETCAAQDKQSHRRAFPG